MVKNNIHLNRPLQGFVIQVDKFYDIEHTINYRQEIEPFFKVLFVTSYLSIDSDFNVLNYNYFSTQSDIPTSREMQFIFVCNILLGILIACNL